MRSYRFEIWFANRSDIPHSIVQDMWDGETYRSYDYYVELAWAAWREALDGVA